MYLLKKKEQPLINVLFIRELFTDRIKDVFDGPVPIAMRPDQRADLIKMSGEGVLSFQHLTKRNTDLSSKLWDDDDDCPVIDH
jgi:hypothetical protein